MREKLQPNSPTGETVTEASSSAVYCDVSSSSMVTDSTRSSETSSVQQQERIRFNYNRKESRHDVTL